MHTDNIEKGNELQELSKTKINDLPNINLQELDIKLLPFDNHDQVKSPLKSQTNNYPHVFIDEKITCNDL